MLTVVLISRGFMQVLQAQIADSGELMEALNSPDCLL